MTPIEFLFVTPDNEPVSDASFEIQLSKPYFDEVEEGIVMPRPLYAKTDSAGKATVALLPSDSFYYITCDDPKSTVGFSYRILVPELTPPATSVRMQDIVLDPEVGAVIQDQALVASVLQAKSAVLGAQATIQTSLNTASGYAATALTNSALAKSWADQLTGEVVVGQGYSARYYAAQAAASAASINAGNGPQLQSNWAQTDIAQLDFIKNKPALATVATSGVYADLTGKPSIPTAYSDAQARAAISVTGALSYNSTTGVISYSGPVLATVATSGSYADLTNKPVIPAGYTLPLASTTVLGGIKLGSGLVIDGQGVVSVTTGGTGTVTSVSATAGSTKVTITGSPITTAGTFTVDVNEANLSIANMGGSIGTGRVTGLATVATSGSYADLANKPAIPAAYTDTQSRAAISVTGSLAYNSATGVISYSAPALATVATSGLYSDLTGKPTIPTNNNQLTNGSSFITAAGAPVQSVAGRTGAVVLAASDVGLGNVNNTADSAKPVSTATQTALDAKLSLVGGILTGAVIASDQQLSRAMFKDCAIAVQAYTPSTTSTITVDYTAGSVATIVPTTTGLTLTLAFSNWPPTGNEGIVRIDANDFGSQVVSIPGVVWTNPNGTETSSLSTHLAALAAVGGRSAFTTGGLTKMIFWCHDAGTTVYGKFI